MAEASLVYRFWTSALPASISASYGAESKMMEDRTTSSRTSATNSIPLVTGKPRTVQRPKMIENNRIKRIVLQEGSRCKAFLFAEHNSPSSCSCDVWLVQGLDPRTGASLSLILNKEGRITGGTDLRNAFPSQSNVFQVNNTFTTIASTTIGMQNDRSRKTGLDNGNELENPQNKLSIEGGTHDLNAIAKFQDDQDQKTFFCAIFSAIPGWRARTDSVRDCPFSALR